VWPGWPEAAGNNFEFILDLKFGKTLDICIRKFRHVDFF
jgi:hypothetical protein